MEPPRAAPPSSAPVVTSALPLSPEEEGRAKLRGYQLLGFIGSGTFAEVSRYANGATGQVVAVKRLKKDVFKSGVNLGAVKELQALQELDHPNILAVSRPAAWDHPRGRASRRAHSDAAPPTVVRGSPPRPARVQLRDTFVHGDRVHLVLDLCAADLTAVIKDRCVAGRGGALERALRLTPAAACSGTQAPPSHTLRRRRRRRGCPAACSHSSLATRPSETHLPTPPSPRRLCPPAIPQLRRVERGAH